MEPIWLEDRGVVRVYGEDAENFLQNLLTCNVVNIAIGHTCFGALLAPQGKILFDFILYREGDTSYLFDLAKERVEAFIKRLSLYKLRAQVSFENCSENYAVIVGWDDTSPPEHNLAATLDPRLAALGWRGICEIANTTLEPKSTLYHNHRIELAVPEGGKDFAFEDVFPHDVNMDQLNGICFTKGCYVGQEIVSRMQHRNTARTRILAASFKAEKAPKAGTPLLADGKIIGKTGSSTAEKLVAMVRIDKALDALAADIEIEADSIFLSLAKPEWATFDFTPVHKG